MKLSTKLISSPGRAEKYRPPLARFVRNNVGSKSRGRSRSSPMFVRKKNAAMETQEPSSPKVTCMGQVRVGRSKQDKTRPRKPKRRCKWVQNALFCRHFDGELKVKSFKPAWRKLVLFCNVGFSRKPRTREESSRIDSKLGNGRQNTQPQSEKEEEEQSKICVPTAVSPPKNALMLTRCRSAPYRSSSLAGIFWGSPLVSKETEQQQTTELENRENDWATSKTESTCIESDQGSRLDAESEEKLDFFKELEGSENSTGERIIKPAKFEELRPEKIEKFRPLILTRCKSEPARTGEKLDLEMNFRKKKRWLGLM
uniref:Uncharacterized protein n=1 Tax=Rhizophora mucronata TaxID=61149 RepID=A0A2P2Q367_RHIMU